MATCSSGCCEQVVRLERCHGHTNAAEVVHDNKLVIVCCVRIVQVLTESRVGPLQRFDLHGRRG